MSLLCHETIDEILDAPGSLKRKRIIVDPRYTTTKGNGCDDKFASWFQEPTPNTPYKKRSVHRDSDNIQLVVVDPSGLLYEVSLPGMHRRCEGGVPSDSFATILHNLVCNQLPLRVKNDYIPEAVLINQIHSIYAFYARDKLHESNTCFELLTSLMKTCVTLPTTTPVVLFRICGDNVMDVTANDVHCIIEYICNHVPLQ